MKKLILLLIVIGIGALVAKQLMNES